MNLRTIFALTAVAFAVSLSVWMWSEKSTVATMQVSKLNWQGETEPKDSGPSQLVGVKNGGRIVGGPVVGQENLSLTYIVKCSACHGRDGKGPVGPSIAGKPFEKNIAILRKYKGKQVKNSMMEDLLTRTEEGELETLSREISRFK